MDAQRNVRLKMGSNVSLYLQNANRFVAMGSYSRLRFVMLGQQKVVCLIVLGASWIFIVKEAMLIPLLNAQKDLILKLSKLFNNSNHLLKNKQQSVVH